jgi:hypothetical protein
LNQERQDRKIFEELIQFVEKKKISSNVPGQLMLDLGKCLLGAPYKTGTLEPAGAEHLVVNLREYDCATLIENLVALAWTVKSERKSFEGFKKLLQAIRYRGGRLHGYSSRLHYFSDWIHDNRKMGLVRDVTEEIGGEPFRKTIFFMTKNPERYPALKKGENLRRMKSIERAINRRPLFFIPKKALGRLEHRIRNGDLIAVTTETDGLDVQHTGLAARMKHRIHLLHASSREGGVVLSRKTLYRYLKESQIRSGIMVARVVIGE